MEHIESNTESARTLASIQIVDEINPHENADSLELATVLGWQIVVRKGEVTVGEKIIFCEIDSLLPSQSSWLPPAVKQRILKGNSNELEDRPPIKSSWRQEATRKRVLKEKPKKYFRVKTIRLRGEISQGLIVPFSLEDLPSLENENKW